MAAVCTEGECTSYGFFSETTDALNHWPTPKINGLRREYTITDSWKESLAPAVNDLTTFIGQVDWPGPLENFLQRRG